MSTLQIPTARVFEPLLHPSRYKGAHGGRGSGKSHFFAELGVERCMMNRGTRIVCVREVQKSLKESVKRLVEDKILALGVGDRFRMLTDSIVTPGDGVILFQGMQDHTAESIKSLEGFDIAYVEEAQTMTARSLEFLRPTIRKPQSELWFSWNPRHASDPVDAFLRGPNPPPDSRVIRTNYTDNPFFPDVLEEERAFDERYLPARYGHIWLGEYEPAAVGAIWDRLTIHQNRRHDAPRLTRIVVGVDPAISAEEGSNETGIIACGLGEDGRGYVLEDATTSGSPQHWAQRAIAVYEMLDADAIVVEVNQGGDMVKHTIRSIRPDVRVIEVRATRGKHVRAEPISALYSIGKISHVGSFPQLESQMCVDGGTLIETMRGQVPVEEVTAGDWVMTREGFAPLQWAGYTGLASELFEIQTSNSSLRVTGCHPIFLPETAEFVSARNVKHSHCLLESPNWANMGRLPLGAVAGGAKWYRAITEIQETGFSIARFIRRMSAQLRLGLRSTTLMTTPAITSPAIWPPLPGLSIMPSINELGSMFLKGHAKASVSFAGGGQSPCGRNPIITAQISAPRLRAVAARPVYNLSVSDGYPPEYYANGILTHNCLMTAAGYEGEGSPDRVDAMVWALTEMFPRLTQRINDPRHPKPTRVNQSYSPLRRHG